MMKVIKTFEHQNQKYEVRLITREDGTEFVKVFKDQRPFTLYYYGIDPKVDVLEFESKFGIPLIEHLTNQAEADARFWIENKHKLR